ncbi:UBP1-associated protein 2B [Brachypodium distachyon]|uniref:RRM domain-containing protein n=1 Tax=Brachypodium distachyon TaxID=15368 RepID=A0A0Q3ENN3_BRADI|nr:UBP1-associated protein 2B [Brachypodium distachyon]KQJ87876.1 hypothetical protein BRADI_4g14024v3 [Brachypodium distachyon]|eukprot:XP_014757941.1 UBP1-associated protein 2B [Brachypodium distachyon]
MGKKRSKKPREKDRHTPKSHPSSTPTRKRKRRKPRDPAPGSDSGSDCSPPSSPSPTARRLLDPYPKPRLAALLASAASADPALLARIRAAADASLSHRRVFVHGLPPRADGPALEAAFSAFGPLADCHVVAAGRCKGYGFLTFKSHAAARRAVRAPCVCVAGFPVSAQFASAGPDRSGASAVGRRVYVANVGPDASVERLRTFFAGFGELEGGPFGLDVDGEAETGRPRSQRYSLFVYREAEGARKAVEQPYRVFEGRTLRCQLAADVGLTAWKKKNEDTNNEPPVPAPPSYAALRPVLDAVVAATGAGDLAMCARNPAQAAALLGQNPVLAAAALSSVLASAGIVPTPATATATATAGTQSPAAVAGLSPVSSLEVAPLPVKPCAGPSGGAGLLGPYKPPSSSPVLLREEMGNAGRSHLMKFSDDNAKL